MLRKGRQNIASGFCRCSRLKQIVFIAAFISKLSSEYLLLQDDCEKLWGLA